MNINEILLQEGIKQNTESNKISKAITIFEKKIKKYKEGSSKRKPLEEILTDLKKIYSDFKELEDYYKLSKKNKKLLKDKYNLLKDKNKILLKKVNSENNKKLLKEIGVFTLIIVGIAFVADTVMDHMGEGQDAKTPEPKDDAPSAENLDVEVETESPKPFIEGEDDSEYLEKRPAKKQEVKKAGVAEYLKLSGKKDGKYPEQENKDIVKDIKEKLLNKDQIKVQDRMSDLARETKAQAKYEQMNKWSKEKLPLNQLIKLISDEEKVNAKIIDAIIQKESSYNPKANNGQDLGLMQLNSKYLAWFKEKFWYEDEPFDVFNAEHNAKIGIRYYKYLLKMFHGNERLALQAYNAGPTAVKSGKVPKRAIAYAADAIKKKLSSNV